jgi:hypothetical protein
LDSEAENIDEPTVTENQDETEKKDIDDENITDEDEQIESEIDLEVEASTRKRAKFLFISERAKKLKNTTFVVDNFHFKGNKEKYCKKHCNPKLFRELDGINTSITEQTNYILGGHKYLLKHTNYENFHFILYIICNEDPEIFLLEPSLRSAGLWTCI